MAESFKKPHLKIQGYSENQDYKYPNTKIRVDFKKPNLDRSNQGNRVLLKLNEVRKTYNLLKDTVLTDEVDWDNVIYIQFISPWGYELKYEQLHSDSYNKL